MIDQLNLFAEQLGVNSEVLLLLGVGMGTLVGFLGFASIVAGRNPAADRLSAFGSDSSQAARRNRSILATPSSDPGAFMKSFIPANNEQRAALHLKLMQAGLTGQDTLRNFTLVRVFLGLVLPGLLLLLIAIGKTPGMALPFGLSNHIISLGSFQIFKLVSILVAVGYFAPPRVQQSHF
jgi:tight adherence protein C